MIMVLLILQVMMLVLLLMMVLTVMMVRGMNKVLPMALELLRIMLLIMPTLLHPQASFRSAPTH